MNDKDIERLVDECIPLESLNPFISTFGSVSIEDLNEVAERLNQNKSYIDLVQENNKLKKEKEDLQTRIDKAVIFICNKNLQAELTGQCSFTTNDLIEILKGSGKNE